MTKTRTRIKICGITRVEDALAAVDCGVDALGLVFYQESPRNLIIKQAQEIVKNLPAFVSKVGLFVNSDKKEIGEIINEVSLDYLQFHGDEEEAFCLQFAKPYIKAIRIKPETNLTDLARYKSASALLIDAWHPELAGGTGESFDWSLINELPKDQLPAIILAGGLTSENVGSAIKLLRPYAVDVSSGVEESPGIKSAEKIRHFVNEVNSV